MTTAVLEGAGIGLQVKSEQAKSKNKAASSVLTTHGTVPRGEMSYRIAGSGGRITNIANFGKGLGRDVIFDHSPGYGEKGSQ